MGAFLVLTYQPAIAGHVRAKDGGELARQRLGTHGRDPWFLGLDPCHRPLGFPGAPTAMRCFTHFMILAVL